METKGHKVRRLILIIRWITTKVYKPALSADRVLMKPVFRKETKRPYHRSNIATIKY